MTTTELTETPEQIVAREGEESHAIHTQAVAALRDGRAAVWRLAECWFELDERRGWKHLGYETLGEYVGSPEVAYSRTSFDYLVRLWRQFYAYAKLDRERIETLEWTKAVKVLPALKAGNITAEDAVSDVEVLSKSDLNEKYKPYNAQPVPTRVGKRYEVQASEPDEHVPGDSTDDEVIEPGREAVDAPAVEVLDAEPAAVQVDAGVWGELNSLPWEDFEGALSSGAAQPRVDRAALEAFVKWREAIRKVTIVRSAPQIKE